MPRQDSDPLGFGLESFDPSAGSGPRSAAGRSTTAGELTTGESFTGPAELRRSSALQKKRSPSGTLTCDSSPMRSAAGSNTTIGPTVKEMWRAWNREGRTSRGLVAEIVRATRSSIAGTNRREEQAMSIVEAAGSRDRHGPPRPRGGDGPAAARTRHEARTGGRLATCTKTEAATPARTAFLFFPNGVNPNTWTPKGDGPSVRKLSPIVMEPMGAAKDEVLVLTNLTTGPPTPGTATTSRTPRS